MIYEFDITPIAKPRLSQRDKWPNARTARAQKYFDYKSDLQKLASVNKFKPSDHLKITFYLPIPQSIKGKKRENMAYHFHQQRPDLSNILKAFEDALYNEDSTICNVEMSKLWIDNPIGRIIVMPIEPI